MAVLYLQIVQADKLTYVNTGVSDVLNETDGSEYELGHRENEQSLSLCVPSQTKLHPI